MSSIIHLALTRLFGAVLECGEEDDWGEARGVGRVGGSRAATTVAPPELPSTGGGEVQVVLLLLML